MSYCFVYIRKFQGFASCKKIVKPHYICANEIKEGGGLEK